MPYGHLFIHPVFYVGASLAIFQALPRVRVFLWDLWSYRSYRHGLLGLWDFLSAWPFLPTGLLLLAAAHVTVRYRTSRFSMTEDYVYLQTGLLSFRSPGGPFSLYNDPIAFSTITDANTQRGLLGFLTGTGTILLTCADSPRRIIRVPWVPKVSEVQTAITARAGVRRARMLSSV